MTKGEISIVAGRPGNGKSTFVLNVVKKFSARRQESNAHIKRNAKRRNYKKVYCYAYQRKE